MWWNSWRITCRSIFDLLGTCCQCWNLNIYFPNQNFHKFPSGTTWQMWSQTRTLSYIFVLAPGSSHCTNSHIRMWYGAPISRRRIYIILILRDVLSDRALQADFCELMEKKLESMIFPVKIQWFLVRKHCTNSLGWTSIKYPSRTYPPALRKQLLLPQNHPSVQKDMAKRKLQRLRCAKKFLGIKILINIPCQHVATN